MEALLKSRYNRKTLILLLIALLNLKSLEAQTDNDNHRKYWYFKTRLNNDFVKVGLGAGESMPFNQRGNNAFGGFTDVNCWLNVGDGSATLGYYIGVLATEYYLLNQNSQNTDVIKHELFCALNAVNRLDYKAEALWTNGAENLNGFFIRDDIPSTLLTGPGGYEHFNYYNDGNPNNTQNSKGFHSQMQHGANHISSNWSHRVENIPYDPNWNPNNIDISMSQDQVYDILVGLALVNKFVPATETDNNNIFGYGSGQTSLTTEARNITGRIIDFMRNPKDGNGNSCLPSSSPSLPNGSIGWRIMNPTTCTNVSTGADAQIYAYALAEIECIIKNQGIAPVNNVPLFSFPFACGTTYHNAYSSTLGFTAWNTTASALLLNPSNPHYAIDTRVFNANLMAIGNCVYGTVGQSVVQQIVSYLQSTQFFSWIAAVFSWVTSIITTTIPGYYVNITQTAINQDCYVNGDGSASNPNGNPGSPIDHAPLLRKVLHGGIYTQNTNYSFKYLLNIAPCDNIYNFSNGNRSQYEWSSDSRLDHPNRRGWTGGNYDSHDPLNPQNWRPPTGEYNGIDYLLYHNLWYIHELQDGTHPPIEDVSNIYVNKNGGQAANSTFDAYETIATENTLFNPNSLEYMRAGKTIYFGPGTEIKTGGTNSGLHAYIQKYDCATDVGSF